MSEIKTTIYLLCKVLRLLFEEDIKPEYFRLGKFNSLPNDNVPLFWKILHKLCCPSTTNCSGSIVCCVKAHFVCLEYGNIAFYALPSDMSSGSQELLLAFASLLATTHLLERAVLHRVESSPLHNEFMQKSHIPSEDCYQSVGSLSTADSLKHVTWLVGKLRHNQRAVANLTSERAALVNKVHVGSHGASGLPHLSVYETSLIKHRDLVTGYLASVKDVASLLDSYFRWARKSHVFWQWAVTVVEESEKSAWKTTLSDKQNLNLLEFVGYLRTQCKKTVMMDNQPRAESRAVNTCSPRLVLNHKGNESEVAALIIRAKEMVVHLNSLCDEKQCQLENELSKIAVEMPSKIALIKRWHH